MVNAIIVDDEKAGAEVLEYLIKQNCPNITIVSIAHTVDSAIGAIVKHKPQLVFLDIEMPTGSGFEVLEATKMINFETIFTTAFEQYALKAFKTNAIDYLLKPIDVDELISAVNKVTIKLSPVTNEAKAVETLISDLLQRPRKISIPTNEGLLLIDIDNIIRLEADSNYTNLYLKEKKKILVSKTLKSIEEQLPKNNFFRVHSAHLINLNEIEKYIKGDGGSVVLKDGSHVPVSRSSKTEFLAKINY